VRANYRCFHLEPLGGGFGGHGLFEKRVVTGDGGSSGDWGQSCRWQQYGPQCKHAIAALQNVSRLDEWGTKAGQPSRGGADYLAPADPSSSNDAGAMQFWAISSAQFAASRNRFFPAGKLQRGHCGFTGAGAVASEHMRWVLLPTDIQLCPYNEPQRPRPPTRDSTRPPIACICAWPGRLLLTQPAASFCCLPKTLSRRPFDHGLAARITPAPSAPSSSFRGPVDLHVKIDFPRQEPRFESEATTHRTQRNLCAPTATPPPLPAPRLTPRRLLGAVCASTTRPESFSAASAHVRGQARFPTSLATTAHADVAY
jgi:hypothetical protein